MTRLIPGAVLLVLAIVLILQWKDWPPDPSRVGLEEPPQTGSEDGGRAEDALARMMPPDPKDSFTSVTDRPLFRPQRRPEEPAETETPDLSGPDLAATLDGMDLSAVIISPDLISAWVRDPAQPRMRRLRIGDELDGWSVQDILPDRVLLERQGEADALILRDYAKSPDAAAPAPQRAPRVLRPMDTQERRE